VNVAQVVERVDVAKVEADAELVYAGIVPNGAA
jgi:hypothetical protein